MIRQTSIDVYNNIKENGLLSERRMQVYCVLYEKGPLTATQIANFLPFKKSSSVGANVHARLGELRSMAAVREIGEGICPETGNTVILWDVTDKLPIKLEKPKRYKCKHCNGKGYFTETQMRLL